MEEWETYTLKELSKGKGEYGIGAPAIPFNKDKYTYLRITDINDDGTLNYSGLMSVDSEDAEKYLLEKNDIVFARTGNSTGRSYFYDGRDGVLVYAGFLIRFRLDDQKVNPRILKYYTHSQPYYNWVKSFDTGGTRGNINAKTYGDMPLCLPPRPIQNRIVEILDALDDKIENNRRINDNLEQQAQALYKQWFVDFDTIKLGDAITTTSGGTPSRKNPEYYDGNYDWVKSKELNCSFIIDTEEKITEQAISKSAAKMLPKKSVLIAMYGATVGQYALLSSSMACNQAVCALLPNENYPYTYLFMFAKNKKEELINKAVGSAQQNISQVLIKDLDISNDILKIKQFHTIVNPFFETIEKNQQEITRLTTLRDTLLPKLMSGELSVDDISTDLVC